MNLLQTKRLFRSDRQTLSEFLRFGAVGVLATGIHYGIYWLLKKWIDVNAAFVFGYLFSFVCNYFLSAGFTFKVKTSIRTGMGFACSHLINLVFQTILLNLFLYWGLNENMAPIPVYAISVPVNFMLVRYVFKGLDRFLERKTGSCGLSVMKLTLITFLIVSVGLIPDWLQYGFFYVGGDFVDQQIPFIMETKRMMSSGIPFWSWNTYLGQNFMASYSFYTLTSPFVWINCLFPYDLIPVGITFTLYLKFICAGVAAFFFLREMHVTEKMCIAGGLFFAFSSYVIYNVNFYHFFEPLICFPLLLLALERFINGKQYAFPLLMGISFATAFINWYFIPCSFIAALLYTACRIYGRKGIPISWKRLLVGLFAVLAGILMSSFVLIPTIQYLAGGSRATTSVSMGFTQYEILIWLQQIRSLFIPKVEETGNSSPWIFNTFSSSAASIPIAGMLLPTLYILKKKDWLKALLIISIVIFVTPLNGIFSLYTDPGYSRWAYAITLFFVLASVKYLDEGGRVGIKALLLYILTSIAVYLFFQFPVFWMRYNDTDTSTQGSRETDLCIFMVFVLSLLLLIVYQRRQTWKMLVVLITIFSCFHLGVRIYQRTDYFYTHADTHHNKVFGTYIASNISRSDRNMNYRTDFFTRENVVYANMAMLKNIPSVSTYNSVKDKGLERLFSIVQKSEGLSNHFVPEQSRTSFDALMSVKEIIEFKDSQAQWEPVEGKTLVESNEDYTKYTFDYYIPMGFTYDSFILENEIQKLLDGESLQDIPKQLLANLVVDEGNANLLKSLLPRGHLISNDAPLDSLVSERRKVVCSSFIGDTKGFKATINLDKDNIVFFSVPSDPGFTAFVDGEKTSIIKANLGLSAIQVPSGSHTIEFRYMPPGLMVGIVISLVALLVLMIFVICEKRKGQTK